MKVMLSHLEKSGRTEMEASWRYMKKVFSGIFRDTENQIKGKRNEYMNRGGKEFFRPQTAWMILSDKIME